MCFFREPDRLSTGTDLRGPMIQASLFTVGETEAQETETNDF